MKIICKKNDLSESIGIVLKAVPSKTTMPILECLVIEVSDNIKLITNDMEIGIETLVEGDIIEKGSIAINAKVFSEIIRKLPDDEVVIESDYDYNTTIKCGKAKFNILGKRADEFPSLPSITKSNSIVISEFSLKEIIRQTVFSIADNENNKIMTGELFEIENNDTLKVVSLDGHRISIRKIKLAGNYDNTSVIVPGKTLVEISKILSGGIEDMVNIFISDKHILFEFGSTIVLSRLIEGEYFKINKMISNDYECKVTINKKEFLDCIDRATLLIRESDKAIIININDGNMELKVNSVIGSMNEDIDINKEGIDIVIGFNPKYLIDALRVIDDEEVDIYLFNPKAPCFIKDKDESYIYLILPVSIKSSDN